MHDSNLLSCTRGHAILLSSALKMILLWKMSSIFDNDFDVGKVFYIVIIINKSIGEYFLCNIC